MSGCWGLPRGKDKTSPFHGVPSSARLKWWHLRARIIQPRVRSQGVGPRSGGLHSTHGEQTRINQGAPGLRDISGRVWHMQNGQRRGCRTAGQEAGKSTVATGSTKQGQKEHAGHGHSEQPQTGSPPRWTFSSAGGAGSFRLWRPCGQPEGAEKRLESTRRRGGKAGPG